MKFSPRDMHLVALYTHILKHINLKYILVAKGIKYTRKKSTVYLLIFVFGLDNWN